LCCFFTVVLPFNADYPDGTPQAIVLGIPINPDGSFSITGWVADPNDRVAGLMRVLLVRQDFSFLWPAYQVEGTAWPTNFFNDQTVVAMTEVDRQTGQMTYTPDTGAGTGAAPAAPGTGTVPGTTGTAPGTGFGPGTGTGTGATPATPATPGTGIGATPATPATPAAAAGTGSATLTVTAPAAGTAGPITGRLTGATGQAEIAVYVQGDEGIWGGKPAPATLHPVAADGTFTITNWVSSPNDLRVPHIIVVAVLAGTVATPALGVGALPDMTAIASVTVERGATATGGGSGAHPAPGAAVSGTSFGYMSGMAAGDTASASGASVSLTVPALGDTGAITGKLTGVPIQGHQVAIYVRDADNAIWGSKPYGADVHPVADDGSFSVTGWASDPKDANVAYIMVVALPAGTKVAPVLGAMDLPPPIKSAAIATASTDRSTGAPAAPAAPATGAAPAAPTGAGGEVTWPPAGGAGTKKTSVNGKIAFAGYDWITKDSGGGRVGPGESHARNIAVIATLRARGGA
jgi:hypothetical protein